MEAGIANVNLVRVSSILPPAATHRDRLDIPPGSLVPTAYGSITSAVAGQTISACVGVGLSEDSYGVIMEFSGACGAAEAEATIRAMVAEAFRRRNLPLARVMVKSAQHTVKRIGCAFAAVPLWY
jgi:arginine decarboxylase